MSLVLKNISKRYGNVEALKNISFTILQEEIIGIMGPSGSGKTTLLKLIAGLERPDGGQIFFDQIKVSDNKFILPPYKRRIGFVFQDLALWPHMTVSQHLKFCLNGVKNTFLGEFLVNFELKYLQDRFPHELSGGEKQRLALARALIARPYFLLLDEPFSNLDIKTKIKMINLVKKLQNKMEFKIFYVTHILDDLFNLAEKVLFLEEGTLKFVGDFSSFKNFLKDWLND